MKDGHLPGHDSPDNAAAFAAHPHKMVNTFGFLSPRSPHLPVADKLCSGLSVPEKNQPRYVPAVPDLRSHVFVSADDRYKSDPPSSGQSTLLLSAPKDTTDRFAIRQSGRFTCDRFRTPAGRDQTRRRSDRFQSTVQPFGVLDIPTTNYKGRPTAGDKYT